MVKGLEEHGDDFELSIARSAEGEGAGADFDSTADKVTEWYQRTDEDGNDVGYDYETGEYLDEDSGTQVRRDREDEPNDDGRPPRA